MADRILPSQRLRRQAAEALLATGYDKAKATAALVDWLREIEPVSAGLIGPETLRDPVRALIDAVDAEDERTIDRVSEKERSE